MNFWKNVVEELEYQGKTRKWLASECDFDDSTLGSGLKRNCIPNAEMALRISHALNVSLDYLLEYKEKEIKENSSDNQIDIRLCKKYFSVIKKLESLPESVSVPICKMIEELN